MPKTTTFSVFFIEKKNAFSIAVLPIGLRFWRFSKSLQDEQKMNDVNGQIKSGNTLYGYWPGEIKK